MITSRLSSIHPRARARGPLLVLVAWASLLGCARAQPTFAEIAPIFEARCVVCHAGEGAPLGLRLDGYAAVLQGSENGPVVVPGDPEASELVHRLRGTRLPRMPLTGPPFLSDEEVARIVAWIQAGAPAAPDEAAADEAPNLAAAEPGGGEPEEATTFAAVEPILLQRCASCHSDGGVMGRPPEGLRLDSFEAVLNGSDRVVVVPGVPEASELMRRIDGRARPRMPFDGPPFLSDAQVRRIRDWIDAGAPDSEGRPAEVPAGAEVRLHGTLSSRWHLDDLPLEVTDATRIEEAVTPGAYVEVRGVVQADGGVRVERIRTR